MRKARQLRSDARYHVTARINGRQMMLGSEKMKNEFLAVICRAKRKYAFQIENFCVMGNHFHLVVKPTDEASLSKIMQWIMSVFAMRFNKLTGHWGHVFGARFFSRIISGLRELVAVFDYIDDNPVKAELITNRNNWPFGGLSHRRRGDWSIVEPPTKWLKLLFPRHGVLLLDRS